jgi:tetratricopeptide (TPR) repeat protein
MKYLILLVFALSLGFNSYAQSVESGSRDFDTLIKLCVSLYNEKKYDEMIAAANEAAQIRPKDPRPHAMSGFANMAKWNLVPASANFAKAIDLAPKHPDYYYQKARADRFRNAKEEGLVSVRKAIELKPDHAEAYVLLADLLNIGAKTYDEQVSVLRKAIELKPTLYTAYQDLGRALISVGDAKGAEEILRKGIENDQNKTTFYDLGRLLVKQSRLVEARDLLKDKPTSEDRTFPNFETVLVRAEKFAAAKLALDKDPNDAEANVTFGTMTMEGDHWVIDGRQEKALVYFNKALSIKPDMVQAQYQKCRAFVQIAAHEGENKLAIQNLDEAIEKLRSMDPKLADEIMEYRRTYRSGFNMAF